jgi:hypothetical protein
MKITVEQSYNKEDLGGYISNPLALGNGRAVFRQKEKLFLLEAGSINALEWSLPSYFLEDDYNLAWFFSEGTIGFLNNTHLALWDLNNEPTILPISNPLEAEQPNAVRLPQKVRCISGSNAAVVLLGKGSAHLETDTIQILTWDDHSATWTDKPMQLQWNNLPIERELVSNISETGPLIRSFDMLPNGHAIVHHTGSTFLGDGGSARYGMDWSLLLDWDLETHTTTVIGSIEKGYSMMSNNTVLLNALTGNKVFLYSYSGGIIDDFSLTPKFVQKDTGDRVLCAFENQDVWVRSSNGLYQSRLQA